MMVPKVILDKSRNSFWLLKKFEEVSWFLFSVVFLMGFDG
jgi:hypothetical protein